MAATRGAERTGAPAPQVTATSTGAALDAVELGWGDAEASDPPDDGLGRADASAVDDAPGDPEAAQPARRIPATRMVAPVSRGVARACGSVARGRRLERGSGRIIDPPVPYAGQTHPCHAMLQSWPDRGCKARGSERRVRRSRASSGRGGVHDLGRARRGGRGPRPLIHLGQPAWRSVRALHSAVFLVELGAILWLVVTGLVGRRDRTVAVAGGLVAVEATVFVASSGVCPLTPLAERLGARRGSVSDIFLPDAIARTIPAWSSVLVALAIVLHLRHLVGGRGPER